MKAVTNRISQSKRYKFNWEDYNGYKLFREFMDAEVKLEVPPLLLGCKQRLIFCNHFNFF